MSTPRIRTDLHATPTEDEGVKYFDVSDPKSGARMRLYDFEWLIAEHMDGRRPYDEVAAWARERLGIAPSSSDLEDFASKLRELGFFELESESAAPRAAPEARTMMAEAPQLAAGNRAADDSGPSLVAESSLLGNDAGKPEAPKPEVKPIPAATAPTAVMPVVTPAPEPKPVPAPNAPKPRDEMTTGAVARAQPQKSGSGSILLLLLVLLVVAGIIAYVKLMGGTASKVSTVVAAPREVVRLFDGSGTVKKSDGQTLSFGEPGKVSDVVAAGTEAKAGMPLATLDAYGKIEKELADVKDREAFYEKQLATATAKGDEAGIKSAEAKVAEKKKLLTDNEQRAAKLRILAPGAGTVAKVLVQAGSDAKAGEAVLTLADKHASAEFKIDLTDSGALKVGETAALQPAGGGAPVNGRIAKNEGGSVTVELPEEAAVKPGDAVRLVKQRLANVVPVPGAAVVHRDSGDVVYVLADGKVHERKVNVVDRNGGDALVASGLSGGDVVVTSGAESLKDGQKASAQ